MQILPYPHEIVMNICNVYHSNSMSIFNYNRYVSTIVSIDILINNIL